MHPESFLEDISKVNRILHSLTPIPTEPTMEERRKRRRLSSTPVQDQLQIPSNKGVLTPSTTDSDSDKDADITVFGLAPTPGSVLDHVGVLEDWVPESVYTNFEPPMAITKELDAIQKIRQLAAEVNKRDPDVQLHEFTIYSSPRPGDFHLVSLHHLQSRARTNEFYVDGILHFRGERLYIQRVPFYVLSIAGYGDREVETVRETIWIQSILLEARGSRLFYRLGQPSYRYSKLYANFLWIADLTKHFLGYLQVTETVALRNFESEFYTWLLDEYATSTIVQHWLNQYPTKDFRLPVVTHRDFLWKESYGVETHDGLGITDDPIWKEIFPSTFDSGFAKDSEDKKLPMTSVTPFIYECFKPSYFHSRLQLCIYQNPDIIQKRAARMNALGFSPESLPSQLVSLFDPKTSTKKIAKGDVVAIKRDKTSNWKDKSPHWFAYVQDVKINNEGERLLDILWLYEPSHTTCLGVKYPHANELFLSSHCECQYPISTNEVLFVLRDVVFMWEQSEIPSQKYFIRQRYRDDECDFTSLKREYLKCQHKTAASKSDITPYQQGDCILVRRRGAVNAEPAIFCQILDSSKAQIRLFQWRRWHETSQFVKPNELLLSDEYILIPLKDIVRKCHVKYVQPGKTAPIPYNRDGQGDCFFASYCLRARDNKIKPFGMRPSLFNDGFDLESHLKLPCLSLFSGGGNFDRGVHEGGACETVCVVEIARPATDTYAANASAPVNIYRGSVDDLLQAAIKGLRIAPQIGQILMLLAGSPCQGYTKLNKSHTKKHSLANASRIASVAAYIDHYRPAYAILENVVAISRPVNGDSKHTALAELTCALVAMGYQVQQFIMSAHQYGSAQTRARAFICITAPGLVPLKRPEHTHFVPNIRAQSLGETFAGVKISDTREHDIAVFNAVTAQAATLDLPSIGRGLIPSIQYPDHRIIGPMKSEMYTLCQVVPTTSSLQLHKFIKDKRPTLSNTAYAGLLDTYTYGLWKALSDKRQHANSHSYQRLKQLDFFPTVTSISTPDDAFAPNNLHWREPRPLTLQEVRRAQGIPDSEVLVGSDRTKWKIVGNSVARQVALPLGISLREAWLANPEATRRRLLDATVSTVADEEEDDTPIRPGRRVFSHIHVPQWGESEAEEATSETANESTPRPLKRLRRTVERISISQSDYTEAIAIADSDDDEEGPSMQPMRHIRTSITRLDISRSITNIDMSPKAPLVSLNETTTSSVVESRVRDQVDNRAAKLFLNSSPLETQMNQRLDKFNLHWQRQ